MIRNPLDQCRFRCGRCLRRCPGPDRRNLADPGDPAAPRRADDVPGGGAQPHPGRHRRDGGRGSRIDRRKPRRQPCRPRSRHGGRPRGRRFGRRRRRTQDRQPIQDEEGSPGPRRAHPARSGAARSRAGGRAAACGSRRRTGVGHPRGLPHRHRRTAAPRRRARATCRGGGHRPAERHLRLSPEVDAAIARAKDAAAVGYIPRLPSRPRRRGWTPRAGRSPPRPEPHLSGLCARLPRPPHRSRRADGSGPDTAQPP